ncbi:putative mitochondrial carrier domain superfamily [Helianthus annuus]|nr:putative mitochondrial carrier domain superfamily [Helianthus annuus]
MQNSTRASHQVYFRSPVCCYKLFSIPYISEGVKKDKVGNIATLLIGSAGTAISSSATFPLDVVCGQKHMQAGVVDGRDYDNMLHAPLSILEKEGIMGLYGRLGPDFIKIVPAAGIY